jgi:hypothetical protein
VLLVVTAVVVRLPTFLSMRTLSFDDAVFGATVLDMRRGLVPYGGVFASQGPLHLPLLYAGDVLGLHTIDGPRVTPMLAGIVVTLTAFAIARRLGASRRVATVVALLLATTGTMLWTTGPITGDGPATALTAIAVWAALRYRDDARLTDAILAGGFFGAALATKPIVVAAIVPLGVWLTCHRRPRHFLAAAAVAAGVWFAAAVPWGLGHVWQQSVAYHTGSGPSYSRLYQFDKLLFTLVTRDGVLIGALVLGVVTSLRRTERTRDRRDDARLISLWAALAALVLVFEKAMFAGHLATIVLPLALLVACRPPDMRWLALALVVLVPWEIANQRDILWPSRLTGVDAGVVASLRSLPRGAEAIADDPGLVWRAGRSTPAQMNDTTDMRVFQGQLTTRVVADAAATTQNCAVVLSPNGFGTQLVGIRPALEAVGYRLAHAYGRSRELWLKDPCRPVP